MALLPRIRHYASFAFRGLDPESKQEAVQSVVAAALSAHVRLVKRGKAAFARPLAMYSIKQYRDGRRFGSRLNVKDVSSEYAQKAKGISLHRLDKFDHEDNCWEEVLVEDRHAGPFDLVRTKLDTQAWLRPLPFKLRRIAKFLARGESTSAAAAQFGLSAGRISQIRAELLASYRARFGDEPGPAANAA